MKSAIKLILITAVAVGLYLKLSTPPAQSTATTTIIIDPSFYDGIVLNHFSRGEATHIRAAMSTLATPRCTEEFDRAGLRSPLQVIIEDGVVMYRSEDLYLYSANQLGLVSEQTRHAYAVQFSSGRAQAGTVSATLFSTQLTLDGRSRIFLHDTAFIGESFLLGTYSLRDVLIHEFIHIGGQPPTPGLLGSFRHDLAGYKYYDDIMAACQ
jgi:hypothetical protein